MNDKISPIIESFYTRKDYSKKIRKKMIDKELKAHNNQLSPNCINIKDTKKNKNDKLNLPDINNNIMKSNKNDSKISLSFIESNNNNLKLGRNNIILYKIKEKKIEKNESNLPIKKDNKSKNSVEVIYIVNSLINNQKGNLEYFINSYKKEEEKRKYPREKMIDPLYYIKYNISNKPLEKGVDKSFKQYIQDLDETKKEAFLLKENTGVNYGKIQIDNSNFSDNEDEKKCRQILKNMKKRKDFNFDLKDLNYYKKIKNNNNNIVLKKIEKRRKNIMVSKFKKLLIDTYRNKNIKFIDSYIDKKITAYKSFDERMKIILNNTKITENNINLKSKYHEKLINKINNIYKNY